MAIPEETPVALEVFPRECEWSTWAFAQTLARHPRTDLAASGFQGGELSGHRTGPDIAFIGRDRLPDPEPAGFPDFAPDLVVEVLARNAGLVSSLCLH